MQMAIKGMVLNPRKTNPQSSVVHTDSQNLQSEGELQLGQLSQAAMLDYGGKPRSGMNRITRAAEHGEVTTTRVNSASTLVNHQMLGEKSEGELENPSLLANIKQQEMLAKHQEKIESIENKKQSSLKSKIKIQSIRKLKFLSFWRCFNFKK